MPLTPLSALVLAAMVSVPGWAVLSIGGAWRPWAPLQRWCLAIAISIAFYPVLFYGLRAILPAFTLGPYKIAALLGAAAIFTAWRLRRNWREQFAFDRLEWVAIAVLAATLFTRFWIIRDLPFPAWSDSLHHSILTELTATTGRLPYNMAPLFDVPLNQYHLGLYALSATVEWLAQVPAHVALVWTAQLLNGLCGLGIYLVLDRKIGRVGAIAGAAVAGLLSHQPAMYLNWGRFTQIASQTILLAAWLVTWQAIRTWRECWPTRKTTVAWYTGAAALLTAAVFLFHFRAAAFYLVLLAVAVAWELFSAWREQRHKQRRERSDDHTGARTNPLGRAALGTLAIAAISLLAVSPALWSALGVFVASGIRQIAIGWKVSSSLYEVPIESAISITATLPLLILAGACALFGLLRRNRLTVAMLVWMGLLIGMSSLYLLGIPFLNITNLGAVLIMFYLPIGVLVGIAAEEARRIGPPSLQRRVTYATLALVAASGFVASHERVLEIEPWRYLMTPADGAAMEWIKTNTPADARFAVNTHFWLPTAMHGTDGGYWIPYFTGRQTTAACMLFSLSPDSYKAQMVLLSRAAERLSTDNAALDDLRALGVSYVYAGPMGNFAGPALDATRIAAAPGVKLVYQSGGVSILQIRD